MFNGATSSVIFKIHRGNTTDVVYVRPSVLDGATIDANWSCKTAVVNTAGDVLVDTTTITAKSADDTEFKVYLTPTQTNALNPDSGYQEYIWVVQLENTTLTPPIKRDIQFRLGVDIGNII